MRTNEGRPVIPHWFPRVTHMTEDHAGMEDAPEGMVVEDRHEMPYIGDFPPGDDYRKHQLH